VLTRSKDASRGSRPDLKVFRLSVQATDWRSRRRFPPRLPTGIHRRGKLGGELYDLCLAGRGRTWKANFTRIVPTGCYGIWPFHALQPHRNRYF